MVQCMNCTGSWSAAGDTPCRARLCGCRGDVGRRRRNNLSGGLDWVGFGRFIANRLLRLLRAGRPTLAVTAPDGEIARLVHDHQCGLVVAPGRGDELAAAILRLSNSPTALATMGNNARAMLDAQFTRRHAFERWRAVLDQIDASISLNTAKSLAS
jgi:glycosyltransferase involved in cell wall biosynthesis